MRARQRPKMVKEGNGKIMLDFWGSEKIQLLMQSYIFIIRPYSIMPHIDPKKSKIQIFANFVVLQAISVQISRDFMG